MICNPPIKGKAYSIEVFREKFWRLGDKVLSLPSDSKTNNQTEL